MSKEKLKQMEHDYKNAFPINIEWLIEYAKEQAERAEYNNIWSERVRKYKQQDKRYREAIEELDKIYDKEKNIESDGLNYQEGYLDGLDRAIGFLEALEGESE